MTDLTGRGGGYRSVAIRCPGCGEAMRQVALAEAEVDVCDACGGLWVDWFDGEIRAVAAETLRVNEVATRTATLRNEPLASGACPRCTRQLVATRQVIAAGPRPPASAELLRCEECMGAFLARETAELLAWLPVDAGSEVTSPKPDAIAVLEPMFWERVVAALKALFGAR